MNAGRCIVFAHLSEFDVVIVNQGTPVPMLRRMQDLGVNVVVAPMKIHTTTREEV